MKIAAYCRVSTDKSDQINSFESQQRYFYEYIDRQPDWELYRIYADEGITGTNTKKRTEFNRMINDAKQHCFDLILTKEVSRFSRNILDTVSYTRDLRKLGIGVQFMNDGINTLEPDSELRLSIMGSIAQEESRKTSSRVKWGQTRRMEQGVVFGRSMLGYDVKNGKMTVNPQGAEIVRLIFHKYVHERKGTTIIARELSEAGYKTLTGSTNWRNTVVLKILRNEKYCGDLKQKKTITPDYLTHQKKYNRGEEDFIFLKDHHAPIIERELWDKAQREITRRDTDGKHFSGHGNLYSLSGKIICGECGKSFVCRKRKSKDDSFYRVWRCGTNTSKGKRHTGLSGNNTGCNVGFQIREDVILDIIKKSLNTLNLNSNAIIKDVIGTIQEAIRISENKSSKNSQKLKHELKKITEKKKNLLDAFINKEISKEDTELINSEYNDYIKELKEKIKLSEKLPLADINVLENKIKEAEYSELCKSNSDVFYGNLLDRITVFPDLHIELSLRFLSEKWIYSLK